MNNDYQKIGPSAEEINRILNTKPNAGLVKAADDVLFVIDVWIKNGSIAGGLGPTEEKLINNLRAVLKTNDPTPR